MNRRQRKKQYVKAFSKLYDKSLKHGGFERNISISTFKDRRGTSRMFLTLNKSMNYRFGYGELPEIWFDGYCIGQKNVERVMAMIPRFRAWDKEFKEMVQVDALVFDEQIIKATYKNGNVVKEDLKNYVLMQSTGLRDKNGKEIFEGDIVKVTDDDERTNFPDGGIGTICGLDEIFMWYIDGQVHNGLFDISQEYYIEAIGNIYENPELAEVSS